MCFHGYMWACICICKCMCRHKSKCERIEINFGDIYFWKRDKRRNGMKVKVKEREESSRRRKDNLRYFKLLGTSVMATCK